MFGKIALIMQTFAVPVHLNAVCVYDNVILAKENTERPSREQSCEGFSYAQTEVIVMGYRKVGYLEQAWYIIKYKLGELFRRR